MAWARENAEASGLKDAPIRWITDDVQAFVEREVRRKSQYHGVILDPPSYGRGTKSEVWKIEESLPKLLDQIKQILAPDFAYILLSAHSPGYSPISIQNVLQKICDPKKGKFVPEEMVIEDKDRKRPLPSGACSWYLHNV
jgi:23S rRNA (cytosine1962-C5)-methyltransferase